MRGTHKLLVLMALTAIFAASCPPAAVKAASKFEPPVTAAISRHFDLSNGRFAAGGHRGVDFTVQEGTPVRASGAGVVSFAGNTPEGPYVTITHDGGIKTTYSLGEIAVIVSQQVGQGTTIGTSGRGHGGSDPVLHFGALINGNYVDPLLLLGNFEDVTDLISLEELRAPLAPDESELASVGAGPAPPDLASFEPVPAAGLVHVGPGTAPGVAPISPITGPNPLPIPHPKPETLQGRPLGPPALRGPPLPSRFFQDDFTGEGGVGDGLQFNPRTGLPVFKAPKLVRNWWFGLTEEEQKALINRYPLQIGHLVGVPSNARDRANRLALTRRIKELETMKRERDELLRGFPEARSLLEHRTWLSKIGPELAKKYETYIGLSPWRRRMTALSRELAGAKNLQRQLEGIANVQRNRLDATDVYLMELDTSAGYGDGQAVVAFGDPGAAEHIGIVVPGINNTLLNVENPMGDAAALRSTVADNESVFAMNQTSTITWLGYDPPNGLPDATNKAEAREGADRLEIFVDALRASHERSPIRPGYSAGAVRDPHIAGFSHSYGSVVAGMATKQGMDIDDLAVLGSPGGGVMYGSELASIHRGVWAARTPDDPIRFVPPTLGQDPMDSDFGAEYIPLDVTQSGHDAYFNRRSQGLRNMAWLLTGRYDMIQGEPDD